MIDLLISFQLAQVTPTNGLTTVQEQGHLIIIDGGDSSNDGLNVLHDFINFNLEIGQQAIFNDNLYPNSQNTLVRVLGNSPSVINGLISSPNNFFLLNPNGIIIGRDAALNIGGSFYASTATSIGFSQGILNPNDFLPPDGYPVEFGFPFLSAPLINLGRLVNNSFTSLSGGTVLNLGEIVAPSVLLGTPDIVGGVYSIEDFAPIDQGNHFVSFQGGRISDFAPYLESEVVSGGGIELPNGVRIFDGDIGTDLPSDFQAIAVTGRVVDTDVGLPPVLIPDPTPDPQPTIQPSPQPTPNPTPEPTTSIPEPNPTTAFFRPGADDVPAQNSVVVVSNLAPNNFPLPEKPSIQVADFTRSQLPQFDTPELLPAATTAFDSTCIAWSRDSHNQPSCLLRISPELRP